MLSNNILNEIKDSADLIDFIVENGEFDVNYKKLTGEDLEILLTEYPKLLNLSSNKNKDISCLTIIKKETDSSNYIKLKKIKLYFNENSKEILKVLQN